MPLGKDDNPKADKATVTDAKAKEATQDALDEGAGAPDAQMAEAEALPEKDDVQKGVKAAMLADTGKEEAEAKLKVVEASPDSIDTPSGYALSKVAHIADNVERGEEYTREKTAKRWGYVPVTEKGKK